MDANLQGANLIYSDLQGQTRMRLNHAESGIRNLTKRRCCQIGISGHQKRTCDVSPILSIRISGVHNCSRQLIDGKQRIRFRLSKIIEGRSRERLFYFREVGWRRNKGRHRSPLQKGGT